MASPKHVAPVNTLDEVQHIEENTRAPRQFSNRDEADFVGNGRENGHDVALPGLAALALRPAAPPVELTWPCPDCRRPITEDGHGHERGVFNPCRAPGRGGRVERCPACNEFVSDYQAPEIARNWHHPACPVWLVLIGEPGDGDGLEPTASPPSDPQAVSVLVDEPPVPPEVQAHAKALIDQAATSARAPRRRKEKVAV